MSNSVALKQEGNNKIGGGGGGREGEGRGNKIRVKIDGLVFASDFDSGNALKVEKHPSMPPPLPQPSSSASTTSSHNTSTSPVCCYAVWIAPDCYQTSFENRNKTWFYFSVSGKIQNNQTIYVRTAYPT